MTHSYAITGMTCNGCATKVQKLLSAVDGIKSVNVSAEKNEAAITMNYHVQTIALKNALKDYPKYQLTESPTSPSPFMEKGAGDEGTYKPIYVIFAYITGITFLVEVKSGFSLMHWMSNFMGAFFLTFSFFKMLDLKGFADSYSSYDIIAKHWMGYGYVYAFIELALGVAFITGFNPLLTNTATFIVMSISITGVLQSVFNKRKIKCACLGAVFNLPMSTVTIMEDLLMIIMSAITLVFLLV